MRYILQTRLMHWKKHWLALLFWLLFPLAATTAILFITNTVKEDSSIPVGIVMEDQSDEAVNLLESIKSTEFIQVSELDKRDALQQLKKHQLDSVFVIRNNYGSGIRQNNRNQLIGAYQSDLSFAYTPVKEMLLSYIQQETGRMKAVHTIQDLAKHYDKEDHFTEEDITAKADKVQSSQDLLNTAFTFGKNKVEKDDEPELISIWGLWIIFTLLSTLLLFDWIVHEKRASVKSRFAFTRYSFKHYLILNSILYTILGFMVDMGTISLFWILFHEKISIWSWIVFRMLLNTAVFLFANWFKHFFVYYTSAFAVTLVLAVGSGAILPISGITDKWPWTKIVNPLHPILNDGYWNVTSWFIVILAILWYYRKENFHAAR